ncbi:hypothetical protein DOM21_09525 [Bacteriovorax stolpii]|uniref:hypothetical protein n=1 Tax=Bacteriovorax stolpii TaxID=960 RepID=UPI0011593D51|nr:hypothetical protein [Bacteriovorax stolpii]QDK41686.1 hypothetical protein DOM21_09525 [Bacteriovorax stolpii]
MMKKTMILFLLAAFFSYGCSAKKDTSQANLKINLSNITNMTSGIGSGGTILFGKSSTGEQFGKVISSVEETLELPNGEWNFYAVMWTNTSGNMMSDVAYCGRSSQKLTGAAVTVSLKLTNGACADNDFSGGNVYEDTYTLKKYFSKLFVEECEDMSVAGAYGCNADNQGSARSYRMVFRSYKGALGAPVFGSERIQSACIPFSGGTNLHSNGMGINFPAGSASSMPFVVSVEMFLGSDDCNSSDPKGIYTQVFKLGLGGFQTGVNRFVSSNANTCSVRKTTLSEQDCVNYLGAYSGSSCSGYFPPVMDLFLPDSTCQSGLAASSVKSIKQMVAIPKNIICTGVLSTSVGTGDNPYAGGKGVLYRPYKICNEWQLNQIGESNTLLGSAYDSSHYKLMNNLDMNKTSNIPGLSVFPAPSCAGDTTSKTDYFHNLNPLDGHLCGSGVVPSEVGFTGVFDGANYVISNGRISAENLSQMGFVRLLGTREISGSAGKIKRLSFNNLSVRGLSYVGGVAGDSNGMGQISDVRIDELDVESAQSYAGGLVGQNQGSGLVISRSKVLHAKIRGQDYIGGLAGQNDSTISESMFSGVVTSDNSSSPYFAGGITGVNNATGIINSSFSEGFISTYTSYIGGIAGKNFGGINDVYSTMGVSSLRNSPGTVSAGGIVAYNSGTITNCFSDTRQMYMGGATFNYSGTIQTDSGTVTNCLTDVNNVTAFLTGSYTQIRTNSWLGANFMAPGGNWKYGAVDGMTPRLSWENRECLLASNLLDVSSQVSTLGRGTEQNPVIICNSSQFLSLNARSSSEYYRLGESINLSSLGVTGSTADGINTFNGKLNGDGHALYGMDINIDNVMDGGVGIFKTVSSGAVVSRLDLYANRVYTSADSVSQVAILANTNMGELSHISSYASSITADYQIGTIAYANAGAIKDVQLHSAHLVGNGNMGGVVADNSGRLDRVSAMVNIGSSGSASYVGGILVNNNSSGVIDQASVRGEFNLTSGPSSYIGGVVATNTGTISNTYVPESLSMNIAIAGSVDAIGGIVGANYSGAAISKSFFLGKIVGTQSSADLMSRLDTDSTTDERKIGPIVGKSVGGLVSSSLFVNDFLLWGPSYSVVLSCDDSANEITFASAPSFTSGALSHHSFSFLAPFTATGSTITVSGVSLLNKCPTNGETLNLYESHHNYAEYGTVITPNDFSTLTSFSGRGFSIALGDSTGALAYHMAKTYKTAMPSIVPVWVIEPGEDYPKLLQLER